MTSKCCLALEAQFPLWASGLEFHLCRAMQCWQALLPLVWRSGLSDFHRWGLRAYWTPLRVWDEEGSLFFQWGFEGWLRRRSRRHSFLWTCQWWCIRGLGSPWRHWLWESRKQHHPPRACAGQTRRAEAWNGGRWGPSPPKCFDGLVMACCLYCCVDIQCLQWNNIISKTKNQVKHYSCKDNKFITYHDHTKRLSDWHVIFYIYRQTWKHAKNQQVRQYLLQCLW